MSIESNSEHVDVPDFSTTQWRDWKMMVAKWIWRNKRCSWEVEKQSLPSLLALQPHLAQCAFRRWSEVNAFLSCQSVVYHAVRKEFVHRTSFIILFSLYLQVQLVICILFLHLLFFVPCKVFTYYLIHGCCIAGFIWLTVDWKRLLSWIFKKKFFLHFKMYKEFLCISRGEKNSLNPIQPCIV